MSKNITIRKYLGGKTMRRILAISVCILLFITGCVRKDVATLSDKKNGDASSSDNSKVFVSEDDKFRLKLFINGTEFKSTDKIDIYATLEYIGDEDEIKICHSDPYFDFVITDHKGFNTGGVFASVLKYTVLKKGEVKKIPYCKSGSYSGDDPNAEFWDAFYAEEDLYLPKGEYTISGICSFTIGDEPKGNEYSKAVKAQIKVN